MTVKQIYVRTPDRAFQILEQLAKDGNTCFRGHRDARWRLQSTPARHRRAPPPPRTTHEIDEMIDHFLVNLALIGIPLPFDKRDRRGRLEFARHYGVPSPLIDFSLSPYVALFFAFNGVRPLEAKKGKHAALYCLNVFELAGVWARQCAPQLDRSIGPEFSLQSRRAFR
jgi:FRG domain